MKLTILIGPPGSGKSTYAKSLESQGVIRISQDDQGKQGHMELFQSSLAVKGDIVIDRMNMDKAQRNCYTVPALSAGYEIEFIEFCVPRAVCFSRCMERTGHPTIKDEVNANSALTTFFSKYEPVTPEEGTVTFQSYSVPSKKSAVMCDLDGTLANLNHRLHFVRREGKKDWGSFFLECGKDGLYECVAGIVKNELNTGTSVVFCSGRDEEQCLYSTHRWLEDHKFYDYNLVMRPKLNYKADNITKIMLYRYEIEPYYNVKYVLDDRNSVVKAWRDIGLVCLQVREGNF